MSLKRIFSFNGPYIRILLEAQMKDNEIQRVYMRHELSPYLRELYFRPLKITE